MTFEEIFDLTRKIINEETGLNYQNEELAHYVNLAMLILSYRFKPDELKAYSLITDGTDIPSDYLFFESFYSTNNFSYLLTFPSDIPDAIYYNIIPAGYFLNNKIYLVEAFSFLLHYYANPLFFTFDSGPSDPPDGYTNTLTDSPTLPEKLHEHIAEGAAALALVRDNSLAKELGISLLKNLFGITNENSQ